MIQVTYRCFILWGKIKKKKKVTQSPALAPIWTFQERTYHYTHTGGKCL